MWGDGSRNVFCSWLWHYRWDIQLKTDWRTTGWKWSNFALHSMDKWWHMLAIVTYYAFYISRTMIGMELTGQMTDWKIWDLFEIIRTNFSKFYNPSEHLAVDEVIVKFKERVLFKQYIPKNPNVSASKCSNYATLMDVHMTWMFISVKTDKGCHNTCQQPTLQWLIWQGV